MTLCNSDFSLDLDFLLFLNILFGQKTNTYWHSTDRFGEIISAGGKRKDKEFGDQILSFDFNSDNEASRWAAQFPVST